jgi:ABC-type dipeptide/oligopeptide/nickel transport system permease subunit
MTASEPAEIKNQIRITNAIYYALVSGLLLFFIVVIVLIQDKDPSTGKGVDNIFTIIVPVFGLMMMFLSRMIYNQTLSKIDSGSSLIQKISGYRTAKIVAWAMLESACFFALVASMLTSNYLYVAVSIFLFGFFFLMKPSKESLIRDMRLNSDESDLILKS